MGGGKCPPSPHPLPPVAGERAGNGAMRVGELALPVTSCSTQESMHGTSPGQHTRADPVGRGTGELGLQA